MAVTVAHSTTSLVMSYYKAQYLSGVQTLFERHQGKKGFWHKRFHLFVLCVRDFQVSKFWLRIKLHD